MGTVTQTGLPNENAGSTTRWRNRWTILDAHSCASRSRPQSGAESRMSRPHTVERSRGSISARHIEVSIAFIWRDADQMSGVARSSS